MTETCMCGHAADAHEAGECWTYPDATDHPEQPCGCQWYVAAKGDANVYAFVQRRFTELLPDCDETLRDLYALLAIMTGRDNSDVHDAWALWRSRSAPDHAALVPYQDLPIEVARLDDPYVRVVRVVRRELIAYLREAVEQS